jgi:exodeoxyribonuclease V alpha subunit
MTPGAPSPAAPAIESLDGTLERVVYQSADDAWSVVKLSPAGGGEPVTAVGKLLGVQPGESLHLEGSWDENEKFGRQFKVASYRTVAPATVRGIERYLGSGLIRGIGRGMAKRLVEAFGIETLEVIERRPERLAEVPGIGPKRRAEIARAWSEQREIKEVMVFLQSHGVATSHAIRIYKTYGGAALGIVRRDPYRLATDVYGIGFKSADDIAASLGLPADSPERARAGLLYTLEQASERGHVYLPRGELFEQTAALLGVDEERLAEALPRLVEEGQAVVEDEAVYLRLLHAAEEALAGGLLQIARRPGKPLKIDVERALAWFEERESIELAPQQREAIRRGIQSQVLVVTGGPGTGKTTLVRGIVAILEAKKQRVLLAAPTGRAAKRLTEATGREARTVHRLLEVDPATRSFLRGPDRPLTADVVIVDEASMLDVSLAHHVVRAIPAAARLILVGDVDQLPSVGPGRVLAELIDSGAVDVVRLSEIYRQAGESRIVVNAHRVNRGEMPLLAGDAAAGGDFFFIDRRTPEEVVETLVHLVAERIPAKFGFDPLADVQVLTPMNRGLLGTASLNERLRERLNPAREGAAEAVRGGRLFRVGDKVMQVRNDYELEVFNGDLGRVVGIDADEQRLVVDFDGRGVAYDFSILDELVPAFACSIHKSQGSEYPCVVVPLHSQHYVMLERNLLYTALTRARKLVVIVGEPRALGVAVGNRRTRERYTRLAGRLRGG